MEKGPIELNPYPYLYSAPEQYDVIDAIVLPVQRKNLAEIAKMLQQISSGKVFDDNDLFLAPLNDFVLESAQVFSDWFMECKWLLKASCNHFLSLLSNVQ